MRTVLILPGTLTLQAEWGAQPAGGLADMPLVPTRPLRVRSCPSLLPRPLEMGLQPWPGDTTHLTGTQLPLRSPSASPRGPEEPLALNPARMARASKRSPYPSPSLSS